LLRIVFRPQMENVFPLQFAAFSILGRQPYLLRRTVIEIYERRDAFSGDWVSGTSGLSSRGQSTQDTDTCVSAGQAQATDGAQQRKQWREPHDEMKLGRSIAAKDRVKNLAAEHDGPGAGLVRIMQFASRASKTTVSVEGRLASS
jgi:hypothetical protein